jgi:1-acyl-sn-glycerol-3-phosphate acyltransferase
MGEGRVKRAIQDGRTSTTEIKARVPGLRERVPELRTKGTELRAKGTELRSRGSELARHYAEMDVSWARCSYAKAAREALISFGLGPLIDFYVRSRTVGSEVFDTLQHPVVFVANHSSHLDTPTMLRAMPRKWRARTAVAAAADYFYDSRWKARGVALLFNTVPLGRKGGGMDTGATDHVDSLIDQGWNLVMFPEGTRSRDGEIGKVRSGAAVIAANHDIDIVPIYVSGTHAAMPPGQNWPRRIPGRFLSRRHQVEVRFGQPIRPRDIEHRHEAMDEVRAFWERKGLPEVAARRRDDKRGSHVEREGTRFERAAPTPPAPVGDRSTTPA